MCIRDRPLAGGKAPLGPHAANEGGGGAIDVKPAQIRQHLSTPRSAFAGETEPAPGERVTLPTFNISRVQIALSWRRVRFGPRSDSTRVLMLRTHYFVITPEVRTDETVHALRQGWMRSIPHERLHFCVASGSDSALLGQPTMLLLQDVQRVAGTPVTRDAFWQDREISASRRLALKESYNSFLRSKVRHARAMCLCYAPVPCACASHRVPCTTRHAPCALWRVPVLQGTRHGA